MGGDEERVVQPDERFGCALGSVAMKEAAHARKGAERVVLVRGDIGGTERLGLGVGDRSSDPRLWVVTVGPIHALAEDVQEMLAAE